MQVVGKKNRSTVVDRIIINTITKKQRLESKNTYTLYADPEKCFDKMWLIDSLKEMVNLGYSKNDMLMLYKLRKNTEIILDNLEGKTQKERQKQQILMR